MNNNSIPKHYLRIIILAVLFILVLVGATLVMTRIRYDRTNPTGAARDVFIEPATVDGVGIDVKMRVPATAKVGQPFVVEFVADTGGESILGYDILLGFSTPDYTISDLQPSSLDYFIVTYKKNTHSTFTSSLKSKGSGKAYNDEPLARFNLTVSEPGKLKLHIYPTMIRESSKFMYLDQNDEEIRKLPIGETEVTVDIVP